MTRTTPGTPSLSHIHRWVALASTARSLCIPCRLLYASHGHDARRYALTMGDSLVRTNGQLLNDLGVDMLLITYADIVFTETTLRVVRSVGWTLKEVRGPDFAFTFAGSTHPIFFVSDQ